MAALFEKDQIGKREDLSDMISNVDSAATPLLSTIPKGKKLTNTLMSWQMDSYANPDTDGIVDGVDVTAFENAAVNRVMAYGRVQKRRRTPMVSDMAENVSDVAGIGQKKEMAKAIVKKLVELKRDIETVMCSDNESVADNGTNAYKTRGLGKWIQATAQSDLPVDSSYLTPSASIDATAMASVTEVIVQAVLTSQYTQVKTKKTYVGLCGPTMKQTLSNLAIYQPDVASHTIIRRQNFDGDDRKLVNVVDVIEGDFGVIELHPSTFLAYNTSSAANLRRMYVLDMDMLELRWNRLPGYKALEDQGGGPRRIVDAIFGLVVKNPLGLAKFNATT